jgi:hypothetical protein
LVQIIENWSDISGKVRFYTLSSEVEGFAAVTINVENVRDVPGYANLLSTVAGTEITILVPQTLATQQKIASGTQIDCRVRRGGPNRIFIHPDHCFFSESTASDSV